MDRIKRISSDTKILDRTIAVGYAGSASVAFTAIATLQAYLSSLTLGVGLATPTMSDVCNLARTLLDQSFRQFGELWGRTASCELVLFGYLPADRALKGFSIKADVSGGKIALSMTELPFGAPICTAFGNAAAYFTEQLKKDMTRTGNFHPFNLLRRIIEKNERDDVGGHIQVAIASASGVMLPHVVTERLDRGEFDADVTFLGRDVSTIGKVGNCLVGKEAVGPDVAALVSNRKKAGY